VVVLDLSSLCSFSWVCAVENPFYDWVAQLASRSLDRVLFCSWILSVLVGLSVCSESQCRSSPRRTEVSQLLYRLRASTLLELLHRSRTEIVFRRFLGARPGLTDFPFSRAVFSPMIFLCRQQIHARSSPGIFVVAELFLPLFFARPALSLDVQRPVGFSFTAEACP
jgi:hypothetical protein